MKIAYFPNQTALQSQTVWEPFVDAFRDLDIEPVENDMEADCAVIWSALWAGRMKRNKEVFDHYRKHNKNVFIIEVGSLKRGVTWKIALNNITTGGIYPDRESLDPDRPKKLGIFLGQEKKQRLESILIAAQHPESHQWNLMPDMNSWVQETIRQIRKYSKRPIVIRQHPRWRLTNFSDRNVIFEKPERIQGTYDKYNITYDHHCVINHNSGVGIQAAIHGTPIICHRSSLAFPVSCEIEDIENPFLRERDEWFLKMCHTEWTVEEIAQGIPQKRLLKYLT